MNAVAWCIVMGLGLSVGVSAGAQTSSNGVVTPTGSPNKMGTSSAQCVLPDGSGQPGSPAQVDANCTALAPGFIHPGTNMPRTEEHPVTAVIRVNSVVGRPDKFPYPMDFQTVGDATMLKARLPQVRACLGLAKSWTKRANAATSATCIDHKGEILAYQECKPADGGAPMVCSTAAPGENPTMADAARP